MRDGRIAYDGPALGDHERTTFPRLARERRLAVPIRHHGSGRKRPRR